VSSSYLSGISETVLLSSDNIEVGEATVKKVFFGAITDIQMPTLHTRSRLLSGFPLRNVGDDFYPEGVWGFGYPILSPSGAQTVFNTMTEVRLATKAVFC
jgi:hypothetical protein